MLPTKYRLTGTAPRGKHLGAGPRPRVARAGWGRRGRLGVGDTSSTKTYAWSASSRCRPSSGVARREAIATRARAPRVRTPTDPSVHAHVPWSTTMGPHLPAGGPRDGLERSQAADWHRLQQASAAAQARGPRDQNSARTAISRDEAKEIMKAAVLSNLDRHENIRDGKRPDFDDVHFNATDPNLVGHFCARPGSGRRALWSATCLACLTRTSARSIWSRS